MKAHPLAVAMRQLRRWLPTALFGLIPIAGVAGDSVVSDFKMGGDISVESAPGGANLRTLGGSIEVGKVGGQAKLSTNGGDIKVDSSSGGVEATTLSGNIDVTLASADGSGRRIIDLTSNAGEVRLRLPHDFGASVDVLLTYTDNQPQPFKITESLGLRHDPVPAQWDDSHGTPRKTLRAHGTIGDGKHKIVISTINGDVTIIRD